MIIRKINKNDFEKYSKLIESNVSQNYFNDFVNNVLNNKHIIYVIELNENIIGSGTLFIEKKLTYGGCKMGHIENIFIDKNFRGNGYGEKIVNKLLEYAKNNKCYRVDLSCVKELENFYTKNNFSTNNISMSVMFKENFK